MSKFILRKRTSGFTTVSNNVIHALKGNLEALALYLYLLSLPDNWEFYKINLCKECKIGIKKLEKLLKILSSFELVQYGQKRNNNGQFEGWYLDIYDTESIKNNNLSKNGSPVGQNCRTVETVGRSGEAIKEVLQNKDLLKNKENISCPSENDGLKFFDQFWEKYPRKQKKIDSIKIWKRHKLDDMAPIILKDIQTRNEIYWKHKQKEHIPMPSTYLNGQGWTDELIKPAEDKKPVDFERRNGEIKSTVQWFNENH